MDEILSPEEITAWLNWREGVSPLPNIARMIESHEALRRERDDERKLANAYMVAVRKAEGAVAVLTEDVEYNSRRCHEEATARRAAEARIAVLEAGLRRERDHHAGHERWPVVARIDAVLGGVPAAAPAPAAWAPEIQEWAIINRALTASEQDRVYELARSGTPIADALRTVAQEGDTVTEGEVEKTE